MNSENAVLRLLRARWGGRSISPEPLSDEVIEELIEAIRLTPSCSNKQPWRYLFLETPDALAKGHECLLQGNRVWASRAPLLVIGYSRRGDDCVMKGGRVYHQFDLGLSAMNLMLSATHHGLAARPMAGFRPSKVRELFALADEDEPLVMVAIGKPSEDEEHLPDYYKGRHKKPRERKPASEIVKRL
jgi:nitroreductase